MLKQSGKPRSYSESTGEASKGLCIVFDRPSFVRTNYSPVIVIMPVAAFAAEAAGLMGARGSQGLGDGMLELGDRSAACLASAGVSPAGWQRPC